MLLRYCVFTFILAKLGCFGVQWQILDDFLEAVRKYSRTGDEVVKVIDDFIVKKKYDTVDFLYNVDHTPYLERSELRPNYCTHVHQHLETLVYSFKTDIVKLQTPLVSITIEIKERLSDLLYTLDIYQKLADNKYHYCRQDNSLCEDRIVHWLKEKMDKIQCRLTVNCVEEKNHTVVQRSVSGCAEFQCSDGECIPYDKVCNGEKNCSDQSDETPNCTRHCFNGFHCRDLRCIEKNEICDGIHNCEDGSDEENCQPPESLNSTAYCSAETGGFLCSNKHCVALEETCDGKNDCGDYSDEGFMCQQPERCSLGPNGLLCLDKCPDGTVKEGGMCRPVPQRALPSLEGLFEQVPYLLERYGEAEGFLKKRLISNLEEAFLSCHSPPRQLRLFRYIGHASKGLDNKQK